MKLLFVSVCVHLCVCVCVYLCVLNNNYFVMSLTEHFWQRKYLLISTQFTMYICIHTHIYIFLMGQKHHLGIIA